VNFHIALIQSVFGQRVGCINPVLRSCGKLIFVQQAAETIPSNRAKVSANMRVFVDTCS